MTTPSSDSHLKSDCHSTHVTLIQITNTIAGWLNQSELIDPHWSPAAWETFQFACRVHGVAPLLYPTLRAMPWLDNSRQSWLAEQYHFNAQRIARMQAELQAILILFSRQQLPVIPLKGSLVTAQYYAEAGLRPMADLDLLIRPGDFATATQLLAHLGYQPEVAHWKHTEFVKPENRAVVARDYEHPDNPRKLEVHLHCRETFGGPTVELTDLMWRHATPGELLGETAWLIQPEPLWLHLLVHATYHFWQGRGRLIHLVDLARVTPHLTNPQAWLNRVEARFTYPSLALLHRYFPDTLDPALLASQRVRVSASFWHWVDSLNLVNTSHLNPRPPGLYLLKALKFSEGRPAEVAQALRFALLPSLAEISLDHPHLAQSKAPWLAYFLLPFDWVKRVKGKAGSRKVAH